MTRLVHQQPLACGRAVLFFLLAVLAAPMAAALPEDANQPLEIAAGGNAELFLDQGLTVLRGSNEEPVVITKGSMQVSGTEIRIQSSNDAVDKVTATGSPARFQHQVEAGQEPIHASGLTLTFDNTAQTLAIHEEAELLQAGTRTTAYHFDYDLTTSRVSVTRDPNGEQIRIVIPPAAQQ